jgi:hypothetical protein
MTLKYNLSKRKTCSFVESAAAQDNSFRQRSMRALHSDQLRCGTLRLPKEASRRISSTTALWGGGGRFRAFYFDVDHLCRRGFPTSPLSPKLVTEQHLSSDAVLMTTYSLRSRQRSLSRAGFSPQRSGLDPRPGHAEFVVEEMSLSHKQAGLHQSVATSLILLQLTIFLSSFQRFFEKF